MKNIKVLFFLFFSTFCFSHLYGTGSVKVEEKVDSSSEEGALTASLDSLVNLWYVKSSATDLVLDSISVDSTRVCGKVPDSVYIKRLSEIVSPLDFPFNSKVRTYIELYTQRRRGQVEVMLGLSDYYFPIFEEALDAAQLPIELKYLPIIESALNPRAFSRAGASGLWQFMYYTGKQYGLHVNSFVDERRDPIESTKAAVSYLKDLYDIYGDWYLVIAAYNCGPGNVNKAIKRSGGKRDYWEIYYRLPKETRGYVPAFIAAAYTFNYSREHYLFPRQNDFPVATDTLMINRPLHFKQVAAVIESSVEQLRDLNPQYRRDVIPAEKQAYPIRIPIEYTSDFIANEDSIMAFERGKYFSSDRLVVAPSNSYHSPSIPKGREKVYYTVKSGDAVGLIADWYDVYSSDLRYWNNIRRNVIRVGQKLVIYVPKKKVGYYSKINSMTFAQKQGRNGKTVVAKSSVSNTKEDADFVYYTVRNGDNLWSIAKKYPGVSNSDIMQLNKITDARRISPGQRLKIKRKS